MAAMDTSDSMAGLDPFGGPAAPPSPAAHPAADAGPVAPSVAPPELHKTPGIDSTMTPIIASEDGTTTDADLAAKIQAISDFVDGRTDVPPDLDGHAPEPAGTPVIPVPVAAAPAAPAATPPPPPAPAPLPEVQQLQQELQVLKAQLLLQQQQQQDPMRQVMEQLVAQQRAQAEANQPQVLAAQIRAAGLDPTNRYDVHAFQQAQRLQQLEAQNQALHEQFRQQAEMQQWRDVQQEARGVLASVLESQLGQVQLPGETMAALQIQAATMAWQQGVDMQSAVAATLRPLLPIIQRTPPQTPAPTAAPVPPASQQAKAATDPALRATGLSGRNTAGRAQLPTFDQLTSLMYR